MPLVFGLRSPRIYLIKIKSVSWHYDELSRSLGDCVNVRTRVGVTLILMLVFLAVVVAGMIAIAHEKDVGNISQHAFQLLVAIPTPVVMLGFLLFLRSNWAQNWVRKLRAPAENSEVDPKRSANLLIWLARLAIIALVILFLNGLLHIREQPLAPRLVGLAMNLLFTFAIVTALRRLHQRGQIKPGD